MRKLLLIVTIASLLFSCSGTNTNSDSPKGIVNAFIEASKQGDIDGIKKYITAQDVKLLEIGQQFIGILDSTQKNKIQEEMAEEFKKGTKDVAINIGSEKIDGDNATVDVSTTKDGKTETHAFALKKESGQWKISLVSTGMRSSGMTQEEMDTKMKNLDDGMKGMNDSIAKAMEQLKKISPDSLKKLMNQSVEQLKKLKETTDKTQQ